MAIRYGVQPYATAIRYSQLYATAIRCTEYYSASHLSASHLTPLHLLHLHSRLIHLFTHSLAAFTHSHSLPLTPSHHNLISIPHPLYSCVPPRPLGRTNGLSLGAWSLVLGPRVIPNGSWQTLCDVTGVSSIHPAPHRPIGAGMLPPVCFRWHGTVAVCAQDKTEPDNPPCNTEYIGCTKTTLPWPKQGMTRTKTFIL